MTDAKNLSILIANRAKSFVDQTLWPAFLDLSEALVSHLDEITSRIIQQAVYSDSSEAEERDTLPG